MSINPHEFCADESLASPEWMLTPFIFDDLTVSMDRYRILFSPMAAEFDEQPIAGHHATQIRNIITTCKNMTGQPLQPAHKLAHQNFKSASGKSEILGIQIDGVWIDKDFANTLHTSINPVDVCGYPSTGQLIFRTGDQFGMIMGIRA